MSSRTLPVSTLLVIHLICYGCIYIFFSTQRWEMSLLLAIPLIWASITDIQRHEIPDLASLSIASLGLVWLLVFQRSLAIEHALVAISLAALFFAIGEFYYRRWGIDGLGMGDAKLIGGLALWAGFYGSILVILISSLSAIVTIVLLQRNSQNLSGIAFGPFLCLSAWAVWLTQG